MFNLVFTIIAPILIVLGVYIHGQPADGTWYKLPARIVSTILVAAILTYTSFLLWANYYIVGITAISSTWAFCWGPEIGWDITVRRTQAYKASWLTATLLPISLPYIILKPAAYWYAYAKNQVPLTNADRADKLARMLDGIFLGLIILIALLIRHPLF